MANGKYVLKFPTRLLDMPIASRLVSEHGLVINILRARVEPNEEGMLVVEITGDAKNIRSGLEFLRGLGVEVEPLSKGVSWREDLCVDCTACRSICPTGALAVSLPDMKVRFERDKCIACELCVPACAYGAIEVAF